MYEACTLCCILLYTAAAVFLSADETELHPNCLYPTLGRYRTMLRPALVRYGTEFIVPGHFGVPL